MKTIYLSPSIQENNVGKGSYGTEEERMNRICDIVEAEIKPYLTIRRNRPTMTLKQVIEDSNRYNVDVHFAIHSNASSNGSAKGTEVFICKKGQESEKFANCIYNEISALTPWSDRGVKEAPGLYELNATDAQAALIEIDFHDNTESAEWIIKNEAAIGKALARGIFSYFNTVPNVENANQIKEENSRLKAQLAILPELRELREENEKLKAKIVQIAELVK